jgi:hypothetical protein
MIGDLVGRDILDRIRRLLEEERWLAVRILPRSIACAA